MRIVAVLDVARGAAVHAVAGERAHYAPLQSVLTTGTADPLAVAEAFCERLHVDTLYLADLDAITQYKPNTALVRAMTERHMTLWLDTGVRDVADLDRITTPVEVVLGLETLAGPEALGRCLERCDGAFWSLDLRDGRPILAPGADWGTDDPVVLADIAVALGVKRAIVLDLARVGTGRGVAPTADLVSRLKARHPAVSWCAGGGVAGEADLERFAQAGADAVLVGSALHDGRLDAAAVARWNGYDRESR